MPGPSDISRGNVGLTMLLSVAVPAGAALTASTTVERTYTVPGLQVTDFVYVVKPTFQAGIGIANVRVSAIDTLAITFGNYTAGTPTLTAENYMVLVRRPSNPGVALPTAIT